MLRSAAILAVSGGLGGISLYYSGDADSAGVAPNLGAYVVEVGVVFPEAAVRAALPDGVEPTPGFTGGIAIQGGDSPWSDTSGHVWLDVQTDQGPVRYRLGASASTGNQDDSVVQRGLLGVHGNSQGDVVHVMAWPDAVSSLELVVRAESGGCELGSEIGASIQIVSLVETPTPSDTSSMTSWCRAQAEVAVARVTAPPGHPLRPFTAVQVLWAEIMTLAGTDRSAFDTRQ